MNRTNNNLIIVKNYNKDSDNLTNILNKIYVNFLEKMLVTDFLESNEDKKFKNNKV